MRKKTAKSTYATSWLLEWCDSYGFTKASQIERHLSVPWNRKRLQRVIEADPWTRGQDAGADPSGAIATGTALDLSGTLDCFHIDCIRKRADAVVQRTALYFDEIHVVGPSKLYLTPLFYRNQEKWREYIVNLAKLLFYLRRVGAEQYLIFSEKPPSCPLHAEQHAREVGLGLLYDREEDWVNKLIMRATVEKQWSEHCGHWHTFVSHPSFDHLQQARVECKRNATDGEIARASVKDVFEQYAVELVRDLRFARARAALRAAEMVVKISGISL